jgi:hypothetical protein
MLDNPNFAGEFDYVPYIELDQEGDQMWSNVMLANYA